MLDKHKRVSKKYSITMLEQSPKTTLATVGIRLLKIEDLD